MRTSGGADLDDTDLERLIRDLEGPVVIDLSNLRSASDEAGVPELRNLAGQGLKLIGASPYVSLGHDRASPASSPKAGCQGQRRR